MSSANSSAKQRRANGAVTAPPPPPPEDSKKQGLTLPQVLSIIDTRLLKLESNTPDSNKKNMAMPEEFVEEFDERFNILATEIAELKDIVMKLQSYTMDVNKTLLEEKMTTKLSFTDVKE